MFLLRLKPKISNYFVKKPKKKLLKKYNLYLIFKELANYSIY
jgi:hypothetical protein